VARTLAEAGAPAAPAATPPPAAPAGRSPWYASRPDLPRPPFWGSCKIESLPLADVLAGIDQNALFRLSWGAGGKAGPDWQALRPEFEARLERMVRQAQAEHWFAPQALYGYWPVQAHGDELAVCDPSDPARELLRFAFPRQPGGERLCLADFFAPADAGRRDVAALQLVTVGRNASLRFESLDEHNQYTEAYYFHGLSSQLAEAAAAWLHRHIRRELGLHEKRGLLFAWGYPALPDVGEHRKLFRLLPAESELGMALSAAGQLIPEHSTAALVVHHPGVRYFSAK
jgi:5-methyltetrahydrofolate--homocysteine methyltransferase